MLKTRPHIATSNGLVDIREAGLSEANGAAPPPVAMLDRFARVAELAAVKATAKVLEFESGLYTVTIESADQTASEGAGIRLPAVQITSPPSDRLGTIEIIADTSDGSGWLGPEGGTVVVKVPLGGGHLLIATYVPGDRPSIPVEVEIRRLDRDGPANALATMKTATGSRQPPTREIQTEILLHIERAGDQRTIAQGWVGNRGKKLRIEGFGIRPLETLTASDIEYMAFGPNRSETPWVSEFGLCGTRGRGMPLTGFAVRLAPHLRDRFEVEYQGAFFATGISRAARNGEPCTAQIGDDPLEAISLRLIERLGV